MLLTKVIIVRPIDVTSNMYGLPSGMTPDKFCLVCISAIPYLTISTLFENAQLYDILYPPI